MTKRVSITTLLTIAFALTLVTMFGNSRVQAAGCGEALSPSVQIVQTEDGAMRITVDPCAGETILVEFCNTDLTGCTEGKSFDGLWCILGNCRPWTTVLPTTQALPGAYSNAVYYTRNVPIRR